MVKSVYTRSIVLLFVTLLSSAALYSSLNQKETIVYIDVNEVYQKFTLKQEYTVELEKLDALRKAEVDSIQILIQQELIQLQTVNNKSENEISKKRIDIYTSRVNQIKEERERMIAYYDDDIWKKVNKLVEEYAVANEIDVLFGATGNGNLMYGNPEKDMTKEFIEYLNSSYESL